jgi:hypothetical protein
MVEGLQHELNRMEQWQIEDEATINHYYEKCKRYKSLIK